MHLTTYTDYTLRVLMYLAVRPARTATVAEIAAAYDISAAHLNKVVQRLALAGEIETSRGRHGGMRLAKPPEAINLAAVVRRSEPDMDLAPCFANPGACLLDRCCLLQGTLRRAEHAFMEELGRSTLADLIGPGGPTASAFPAPRPERVAGVRRPRARAATEKQRTRRPAPTADS